MENRIALNTKLKLYHGFTKQPKKKIASLHSQPSWNIFSSNRVIVEGPYKVKLGKNIVDLIKMVFSQGDKVD